MKLKNKIKKLLIPALTLVAWLGAAAGAGELLVYEPFDYTPQNIDPNLPVNEGTGLTGAWEIVGGSGAYPVIVGWSVGFGSLPVTGGAWNDGEGGWQSWQLEADLAPTTLDGYLDDGDELWFSFTGSIPLLNQLSLKGNWR